MKHPLLKLYGAEEIEVLERFTVEEVRHHILIFIETKKCFGDSLPNHILSSLREYNKVLDSLACRVNNMSVSDALNEHNIILSY